MKTDNSPVRAGRRPLPRWGAVVVLTMVATLNVIDRYLPSVLAEPMKHDLLLSDTALGLINGFGFLVLYAVAGLPIARLSDRGNYGVVIGSCLGLWGLMTMAGGAAQGAWQLAASRMGVAVGEAGSTPAAHAFISRHFSPERRAAPLSVLTMSVPIAGTIALFGGGLMAEWAGWRMTFVVMGLISLAFVPIVLIGLRGHGGGGLEGGGPEGAGLDPKVPASAIGQEGVWWLLSRPSFLLIVLGTACIAIAGYAWMTFAPAFLARQHGLGLGQVGLRYGVASGVVGVVGLIGTGLLADRLAARSPMWSLWVVVLIIAALVPFAFVGLEIGNANLAIVCIAVNYTIGSVYMAPSVTALQRIAPPHLRATASALMLFVTAMLGGIGPLLVGLFSDALQPSLGPAALGRALLVVPAAQTLAALLFMAAAVFYRRDIGIGQAPPAPLADDPQVGVALP